MKFIYTICSLALCAVVGSIAWEKFASESECFDATVAVIQGGGLDGTSANKTIEAGCARMARNGQLAEKVLSKLP